MLLLLHASAYADVMTLPERLRGELEKRGRGSYRALANKIGVDIATVSRWANGQSWPESDRIDELAGEFGWGPRVVASAKAEAAKHAKPTRNSERIEAFDERLTAIESRLEQLIAAVSERPVREIKLDDIDALRAAASECRSN